MGEEIHGEIKIYYRGVDFLHIKRPIGLRLHPILQDWEGNYYELINKGGSITVGFGGVDNLSPATRADLKRHPNPEPDEVLRVAKKNFLEAVEQFKKEVVGTRYRIYRRSKNCRGFKNYVLSRSLVENPEMGFLQA